MFSKDEIFRKLLGCFEVLLFMPRGVNRFEGSKEQAIKSFIVPIVLLPLMLIVMVALSPGYSWNLLIVIHLVRTVVTIALGLMAVYFLTVQFKRSEYFYKFLNVSNWFNVSNVALTFPIIGALLLGYDMTIMESYAIFVTILSVVYMAFMVSHVFRLPWELGSFIAIVCLAIDQNIFGVALYVRDWVSI